MEMAIYFSGYIVEALMFSAWLLKYRRDMVKLHAEISEYKERERNRKLRKECLDRFIPIMKKRQAALSGEQIKITPDSLVDQGYAPTYDIAKEMVQALFEFCLLKYDSVNNEFYYEK